MKKLIEKLNDTKILHLTVIVLGTIFISISAFHSNMWFDESYSVGIANHSFKDIWIIGGSDVHPILYYFFLHIINLIFGNKIILYRLFSVLCATLLGVLGFTHIRKDFGEKTGLIFSFLAFFFPPCFVYSGEIRMYSLAMLLVSLTAIYAYRIYKNFDNFNIKNWIIFAICSLASAYTHYYALMTSGLINLILMIILIIKFIKTKKFDNNMKAFIICGIIQVILYLPWLLSLLTQMGQVSSGFWIGIHFPDTLVELFTFQFTGNLTGSEYIPVTIALVWSVFVTAYMTYTYFTSYKKNKISTKKEMFPATTALKLFLGIALAACIVSLVIWRPIIYARYMLCVMGLFIFFLAYTMDKKGNKWFNFTLCTMALLISLTININFINTNYDKSNTAPIKFINANIKDNDIFVFSNMVGDNFGGFVICANYPERTAYYYNQQNWGIDKAYKAFTRDFNTITDLNTLNNISGRIWIISTDNSATLNEIENNFDIKILKQEHFYTKYKNYQYTISLIEK